VSVDHLVGRPRHTQDFLLVLRCERRPLGRASTTHAALFHQKCDSERIKITIKYETSKPNSTELNGNNHNSSRGSFSAKIANKFHTEHSSGTFFFQELAFRFVNGIVRVWKVKHFDASTNIFRYSIKYLHKSSAPRSANSGELNCLSETGQQSQAHT